LLDKDGRRLTAAFRRALDEWSVVRDEWVADRKQRLLQKWEETGFRLRRKQIEEGLRIHWSGPADSVPCMRRDSLRRRCSRGDGQPLTYCF